MIRCIELRGEFIRGLNIEIKKGSRTEIVLERQAGDEFLEMLLGLKTSFSGKVFLMDKDIQGLKEAQLIELRKGIGTVFREGGLISNLRAWENLTLPALYHKIASPEIIRERGLQLLETLGFRKPPLTRVSELTGYEKVLIGLGRAALMQPEIIILHYAFDGLSAEEKKSLGSLVEGLEEFKEKTILNITAERLKAEG